MPEHIIEEQVTIRDADIESVYSRCLNWLEEIKADILKQHRPELLKAKHKLPNEILFTKDRLYSNWGKNIEIRLSKKNGDVIVSVIIDPSAGISKIFPVERAKYAFGEVTLDLFHSVGVNIDQPMLQHFYPKNELKDTLKRSIKFNFPFFLVFLIFTFLVQVSDIGAERIFYIFNLKQASIISCVILGLGIFNELNKERRRIRDLYPD